MAPLLLRVGFSMLVAGVGVLLVGLTIDRDRVFIAGAICGALGALLVGIQVIAFLWGLEPLERYL